MNLIRTTVTIAMALSLLFPSVPMASDWKLELDRQEIQIYTRKADGSDYKEFKGVTKLKTSLNSLVALLEDTDACRQWAYKCKSEKTVKIVSDNERYNYVVSDGSPLSDRDAIIHITRTQDATTNTVVIQRDGVPDFIPEKPGIARVKTIHGSWTLRPKGDGYVVITFQSTSDPGGNVPAFLANLAVTDIPFKTLIRLRSEVMKPKYQKITNLVNEL